MFFVFSVAVRIGGLSLAIVVEIEEEEDFSVFDRGV